MIFIFLTPCKTYFAFNYVGIDIISFFDIRVKLYVLSYRSCSLYNAMRILRSALKSC